LLPRAPAARAHLDPFPTRRSSDLAAHAELFLDPDGTPDSQLSRYSGLASGVPGTVAGLVHAQRHYGTLSLQRVMAPAIALAEKGDRKSTRLNSSHVKISYAVFCLK